MKQSWLALVLALTATGTPQAQTGEGVRVLLHRLDQVVQSGDARAYAGLLASGADSNRARDFTSDELRPGATHVVIQERERLPLAGAPGGTGYRVLVDVFAEFGAKSRVATWRLDVTRIGHEDDWRIADQQVVTTVDNLYRLSLNPTKQFDARSLTIAAEDLDLTLSDGSVFVVEVDQGVTGLVLLGRGNVRFHPAPETEREQVKIFAGAETLESRFDAAFVRFNPDDFETFVRSDRLVERTVDPREFRRADEVLRKQAAWSFGVDLGDLSPDPWSLVPPPGDFLAEIRTRRFGTLTYVRLAAQAEDISFFDRKRQHNIAVYASKQRLADRGRFFNENDLAEYDVLDYDVDLAVSPDQEWLDGRVRMQLKVRVPETTTLTLRLAGSLVVQSIVSDLFGRLFGMRARDQNAILITLPRTVRRGTQFALTITYAGHLEPEMADGGTIARALKKPLGPLRLLRPGEIPVPSERSFLYSSQSYWYPQGTTTGYATARLRITVPAAFDCVASGDPAAGFPVLIAGKDPTQRRILYLFTAIQPVRYLAFLVSRFVRAETLTIAFDRQKLTDGDNTDQIIGKSNHTLKVSIEVNPRQTEHGRSLIEQTADIVQFYEAILGDSPYPSFALALVEKGLPGGHSPGYFAVLHQPPAKSLPTWRDDPAVFPNYPESFIAHEIAHQWWGQAVGWSNYHEQWLSEGFAQYFATLYAQHRHGAKVFSGVLRQLRRSGLEHSDQGPIYLGYRLGHIRGDSRIFRALVYNKSAAVLHMLRRLIGDEAFFQGLRRFYWRSRFQKVGTEDFRNAVEAEAGRSLERFFERWIYGSTLPRLKFAYRIEPSATGQDIVLHVEQLGELFDVPLTVRLQYANKKVVNVLVPVTERSIEVRVPLAGRLRRVDVSKDDGTMAEILR